MLHDPAKQTSVVQVYTHHDVAGYVFCRRNERVRASVKEKDKHEIVVLEVPRGYGRPFASDDGAMQGRPVTLKEQGPGASA